MVERYDARIEGKVLKLSIERITEIKSAIRRVQLDKEFEEPEWFVNGLDEVIHTLDNAVEMHKERTKDENVGVRDERVDEVIVSECVYDFFEQLFPFLVTGSIEGKFELRGDSDPEDVYNMYYHRFNSALVDTEFQDVDEM